MQCASSIATKDMVTFLRKFTYSSLVSDSGATYSNFVNPDVMSFLTWVISVLVREEFKTWATPFSEDRLLMAST